MTGAFPAMPPPGAGRGGGAGAIRSGSSEILPHQVEAEAEAEEI